jgi:hypothetical protein
MARHTRRKPVTVWRGPERRYDLIAEGTLAVIFVAVLCIVLGILFGSPDAGLTSPGAPKSKAGDAFSAKYWVQNDPSDFVTTVVGELAASTTTAGYGPPFNWTSGSSQSIIGIKPARIAADIFGLTQPINTANDFVLQPVSQLSAPGSPAVALAIRTYEAAGGDLSPGASADSVASQRQQNWLTNYTNALGAKNAQITSTSISVSPGNYGPVPIIVRAELALADSGALDGYFASGPTQVNTNTSQAMMFFSDGSLWGNIASAQGVAGDQWGVMNEVWNFPGQVWLWLYAGMYQPPFIANHAGGANLDLDVGLLMIVFGFLLPMFAPWIPGINRIPDWIPFYKVIYKRWYAKYPPRPSGGKRADATAGGSTEA